MIIPVALAAALHTCAPTAAPDTMAAIVAVESAGWPYAVNDNSARRSYRPRTRAEALRIAESAIRAHHSVDVGIAQVNSGNFAAFHVDAADMLEPCQNLRVGSAILADAYRSAAVRFPDPPRALLHAVMAYNTGSIYAGRRYVQAVIAASATDAPTVPSIAIITSKAQTAALIMPATPIAARSMRPADLRWPLPADPRQAALRASSAWGASHADGIIRNLDLQINHQITSR